MSYVKAVLKQAPSIDKSTFKQSSCLLTISVGQEVHEGNKFAETIALVNQSFASCVMLIDDSLQRHTMALSHTQSADAFYKPALEAGDAWLIRNELYYAKLTIPTKIIRWDHWLNHPFYAKQQNILKTAIQQNPAYQQSFADAIDEFLRRYYPRLSETRNFDQERARLLCLDYLLEECTALCLWPELACEYETYPSKRNLAMAATHQQFVIPNYPTLLHPIAIKFKNRKQLKPQQFQTTQVGGC